MSHEWVENKGGPKKGWGGIRLAGEERGGQDVGTTIRPKKKNIPAKANSLTGDKDSIRIKE